MATKQEADYGDVICNYNANWSIGLPVYQTAIFSIFYKIRRNFADLYILQRKQRRLWLQTTLRQAGMSFGKWDSLLKIVCMQSTDFFSRNFVPKIDI